MAPDADAMELARLDALIAENDAEGTPIAEERAAWALFDKADVVERIEGADAAAGLFAEVMRRMERGQEPRPRMLLIFATMRLAEALSHGRQIESRAVAEKLVAEHFDDAPPDAIEAVVHTALLLGWLLRKAGEHERALELHERLIERYGQRGTPNHHRTAMLARCQIAWAVRGTGRLDEALGRFEGLIRELDDSVDAHLRASLAQALLGKAYVLSDLDRIDERIAVSEDIVDRFDRTDDPDIAKTVERAREMLDPRWSVRRDG